MYWMAIDIGASSGRHMLGSLEGGKLVLEEIYRFPNGAKQQNGRLYWDVESLFREIKNGLKRAARLGKIPSYVGIDTWAVDYVLLDGEDRRIGDIFCYRDRRGGEIRERAHAVMPFEELYRRTGIQYQPFNTLYQLYDDKLTGKIEGAESMLMLPDWFHFRLTGVKRQEYTNATSTGMVNASTHTWDGEIIDAFGLPERLFLPLAQPGTVVGEFTDEIAEEVGYRATVVLPATHDTASAVLAAPITEGSSPYISSGTWSLLGIEQTKAHTDAVSREVNFSNEGSLNFTFRYQKNIMGLWMIQSVRHEIEDAYSFVQLEALARSNAHEDTVDCNDSRFLAPKSMREEIQRAVGRNMNVGEIAYCISNSLALCYAQAVRELELKTDRRFHTLHIIGGGSKDGLLNELTAKHTGLNVLAGPKEATAIGNLLMQMIGVGAIPDLDTARNIVIKSFPIKEV